LVIQVYGGLTDREAWGKSQRVTRREMQNGENEWYPLVKEAPSTGRCQGNNHGKYESKRDRVDLTLHRPGLSREGEVAKEEDKERKR